MTDNRPANQPYTCKPSVLIFSWMILLSNENTTHPNNLLSDLICMIDTILQVQVQTVKLLSRWCREWSFCTLATERYTLTFQRYALFYCAAALANYYGERARIHVTQSLARVQALRTLINASRVLAHCNTIIFRIEIFRMFLFHAGLFLYTSQHTKCLLHANFYSV